MTAKDLAWTEQGACAKADSNLFFPKRADHIPPAVARLCAGCPVNKQCYQWAIKHEAHGIWAGTTPVDRAKIRQQQNIRFKGIRTLPGPQSLKPINHGTSTGYRTHYTRGEQPCIPCRLEYNRCRSIRTQEIRAKRRENDAKTTRNSDETSDRNTA